MACLTKEERDAIRARVKAVKPYKNTFDNIVQPVVDFYEHAKEDIPRLLDALEAAYREIGLLCPIADFGTITSLKAKLEAALEREAKLVEALRTISHESTDSGARDCARDTLKELGLEG